jgi:hypothetical protein
MGDDWQQARDARLADIQRATIDLIARLRASTTAINTIVADTRCLLRQYEEPFAARDIRRRPASERMSRGTFFIGCIERTHDREAAARSIGDALRDRFDARAPVNVVQCSSDDKPAAV